MAVVDEKEALTVVESIPLAGDNDGTLEMEFPGVTTAVADMVERMEVCPSGADLEDTAEARS